MIKFLDLHQQYLSLKEEMDAAIAGVIGRTGFIGGPDVSGFETAFAAYQQVAHCVGVANGTDAIEIALEALSLPLGSEVIVPANSFIASSEAVTRSGLKVVFADVSPETYTLDLQDLVKRIGPKTSAVIAVHLYGHPCDMSGLARLAADHSLKIIEDCAQAHGAEYAGRKLGGQGDIATFSFYPGKNLGAYGDAGAITTNDAELAKRARMIANHGRTGKYDHQFEGRNSRLDALQAAVLSVKLPHLEQWVVQRNVIADRYRRGLDGVGDLILPSKPGNGRHAHHLFVIRTANRQALAAYLKSRNIETGVHYPTALPKLAAYEYLRQGSEPMFANLSDSTLLSLPIGEHLTVDQADEVVEAVRDFFAQKDGQSA